VEWPSRSCRGEGNRLRWEAGEAQDAPGVRKRARRDSLMRNWRGPTWRPTSGEGGSYKPKVKWSRAERESEGLTVPMKAGRTCWRERALLWSRPRLGVSARACP
jgi:hypothetical protein